MFISRPGKPVFTGCRVMVLFTEWGGGQKRNIACKRGEKVQTRGHGEIKLGSAENTVTSFRQEGASDDSGVMQQRAVC